MEVRLDRTFEKFTGRTIPGTFGPTEYDIGMILTRAGGRSGFVLTEQTGRFRFGPGGQPTKQLQSGIRCAMYGGAGVAIGSRQFY